MWITWCSTSPILLSRHFQAVCVILKRLLLSCVRKLWECAYLCKMVTCRLFAGVSFIRATVARVSKAVFVLFNFAKKLVCWIQQHCWCWWTCLVLYFADIRCETLPCHHRRRRHRVASSGRRVAPPWPHRMACLQRLAGTDPVSLRS